MNAAKKTPVEYFIKKDFMHDKVDPVLVINMTSSHRQWKELNQKRKAEVMAKEEVLGLKNAEVLSKQKAKKIKLQLMATDREDHQDRNTIRFKKRKET